jgi:membrane protease YdiL (CAAX protease family)
LHFIFALIKSIFEFSDKFQDKNYIDQVCVMKIQNLFLLLLFSCVCGSAALYFFPQVYPLISLDITMSQDQAVRAARVVAQDKQLFSAERTVTMFASNDEVKTYLAFAGQGKDDELMLLEQDLYQIYQWQVSLFEEKNIHETMITFTPSGKLYGYNTELSENDEFPNVSKEEALDLVESELQSIVTHFAQYDCVEHSQVTQPCGRIDHTFVYERKDIQLHEALYRCKAVVAGNKIIECSQGIKIPEKFTHQYLKARSANTMLGMIGLLVMYGVYLLLFVLFALYILMQKRQLIFTWPVRYAFFVSVGTALIAELNQYQLWFSSYQTEFSMILFLTQKILSLCVNAGFIFALLCLVSLAAEGLTRAVYGKQVQLWKIFSKHYWYSRQAVEHIFVGYIFLGFFLAYEVFYIFLFPFLGIKSPTDSLLDPNILAHYVPSFTPLMTAFFAGTWEEMMCRAIPIAFVMWWAERQKYNAQQKWYMLIGAFILQSIVFGLLHATYPQQPSYARVLELIPDSVGFGFVYVYYGLVPGMLAHFLYDALMMSLPIFASSDLIGHQMFILSILAAPLLWAFYIVVGNMQSVPQSFLNESWEPEKQKPVEIENPYYSYACFRYPQKSFVWAVIFGLCGMYAAMQYPWQIYTAGLEVAKEQAMYQARMQIEKRFNVSLDGWDLQVQAIPGDQHNLEFIWQQEPALYSDFARVLSGPFWKVSYVHFDGDLVTRQVKYEALVGPRVDQIYIKKTVPESFAGNSILQDEAVCKAQEFIQSMYHKQVEDLELLSVQNHQLPQRVDWEVVFKDCSFPSLQRGYIERTVFFVGDQITQDSVHVKPPQEWQRDFAEYKSVYSMSGWLMQFFVYLCFCLFFLSFIFFYRSFMYAWVLKNYFYLIAFFVLTLINAFPYMYALCNTVEPLMLQIVKICLFAVIYRFFFFLYLELISASVMVCRADTSFGADIFLGLAYGLGLGGMLLYLRCAFRPIFLLYEESIRSYSMYIPFVTQVYFNLFALLTGIMMLYILGLLARVVPKKYTLISVLACSLLFSVYTAFELYGLSLLDTLYAGALLAAIVYILYEVVLSVHPALSVLIAFVAHSVCLLSAGWSAYAPYSFLYHSIVITLMGCVLLLYFNQRVVLQSEN